MLVGIGCFENRIVVFVIFLKENRHACLDWMF